MISEYTAFVAVDVEQNLPIDGAITLCDVTATMALQEMRPMSGLRACYCCMGSKSLVPQQMQMFVQCVNDMASCPPPSVPSGASVSPRFAFPQEGSSRLQPDGMQIKKKRKRGAFIAESSPTRTRVEAQCDLTALISLQQAIGYWLLGDLCDKFLQNKIEAKIKRPPNLSEEVWATIVGLVCLESRYAQQKDEWELIALKAEMWLNSQNLPQGLSIESLKEVAKTVI